MRVSADHKRGPSLKAIGGLVALAGLAACASTPSPSPSIPSGPPPIVQPAAPGRTAAKPGLTPPFMDAASVVRVGVLLPFSTVQAEAQSLYDAAEMAMFDHGDKTTLLIPLDAGGDGNSAQNAAQTLIGEGADVIVGPVLKESVAGASRAARAARVPVIAFSSDSNVAGNGVYLLSFPLEEEVARVVDYANSQGIRSFAILAPDSEYGRRVEAAFRQQVTQRAGSIVATQFYVRNDRDAGLAAQSFARQAATAQAIFLPAETGSHLRAIGPGLLTGGLDLKRVKLMGVGAWGGDDARREPTLAGGWYAAPDPAARADFEARFKSTYGRAPTRLSSLAYDAVALSALLSRDVGGAGVTRQAIERTDGFIGADGVFRFRPDGTIQRALAVLEVRPQAAVTVSPAPKRLDTPGS